MTSRTRTPKARRAHRKTAPNPAPTAAAAKAPPAEHMPSGNERVEAHDSERFREESHYATWRRVEKVRRNPTTVESRNWNIVAEFICKARLMVGDQKWLTWGGDQTDMAADDVHLPASAADLWALRQKVRDFTEAIEKVFDSLAVQVALTAATNHKIAANIAAGGDPNGTDDLLSALTDAYYGDLSGHYAVDFPEQLFAVWPPSSADTYRTIVAMDSAPGPKSTDAE